MKSSTRLFMTTAIAALTAASAVAQNQDLSSVQIKTTKISNNFNTLEGQGGMIGVLSGPDGVLMVDSQFAPLTDKIVAAIKQITPSPIRYVINTHVHGDHTGGNENLAKLGATIFSRDQLRQRLANPNPGANGAPGTPAPAAALPIVTYDQKITFHMNGEDVEAIPVRSAHTDGDTVAYFTNLKVVAVGDLYTRGTPDPDFAAGGSLVGWSPVLAEVLKIDFDTAVPGTGPAVSKADVIAFKSKLDTLLARGTALVAKGVPKDRLMAELRTDDLGWRFDFTPEQLDRFYAELSQAK